MTVRPMASTDLASFPTSLITCRTAFRISRGSTWARRPSRCVGNWARTIFPAIFPFLRMADLTEEEPTSRARSFMGLI